MASIHCACGARNSLPRISAMSRDSHSLLTSLLLSMYCSAVISHNMYYNRRVVLYVCWDIVLYKMSNFGPLRRLDASVACLEYLPILTIIVRLLFLIFSVLTDEAAGITFALLPSFILRRRSIQISCKTYRQSPQLWSTKQSPDLRPYALMHTLAESLLGVSFVSPR